MYIVVKQYTDPQKALMPDQAIHDTKNGMEINVYSEGYRVLTNAAGETATRDSRRFRFYGSFRDSIQTRRVRDTP